MNETVDDDFIRPGRTDDASGGNQLCEFHDFVADGFGNERRVFLVDGELKRYTLSRQAVDVAIRRLADSIA